MKSVIYFKYIWLEEIMYELHKFKRSSLYMLYEELRFLFLLLNFRQNLV